MELLLQTLVSGFLKGGLYALIGIGMTLIMGVMGIINLAHGQLMMVSMYITYSLFALFGVDPYVSLAVSVPAIFALGVSIQKIFLNPLMKIDTILPENQVLMTVGIGMALTEIMRFIFTSDYKSTQTAYSKTTLFMGNISFSLPLVVDFFIAITLTGALFYFLKHTDTGRSIRATAQDRDAATLMGVNTDRITSITFGLGSGLVAAAGTMLMPVFYLFPDIGGPFTRKAFIICILGGLGSSAGAIFGGITLGLVEAFGATYIGMEFEEIIGLTIFLLALLLLPGGLKRITGM